MEDTSKAHSEENTVPAEKNNKRTLKTAAQLIDLEKFYDEHKYPTEEMKSELALRIGLTEKQISSWFCHSRLKDDKSMRDEAYANGRLDQSSSIVQDHGSGLRQDSCGSTKQGDHRNNDAREAESERLYCHELSAAGLIHGRTSQYIASLDYMDDMSSESCSSLLDRSFHQSEDHYDIEISRYLMQNGENMPLIPKGATSMAHKLSGYLKVKVEIENAAITAVKRQLVGDYREDGPPLGVDFQALPPDAFTSPSRDPVTGSFYFGNLVQIHSANISGVRKQSSLSTTTKYEAYSTYVTSPDLYMDGPKCELKHASDCFERKFQNLLKKYASCNSSISNPGGNSPMDSYDDHAGKMTAYSRKRKDSMTSKRGIKVTRSYSISDHHSPEGRINDSEQMDSKLHCHNSGSPKISQQNDYVTKHSKLMLGSKKSSNLDWEAPNQRMAEEDRFYREMKVAKWSRVEIPQQEYTSNALFPDRPRRITQTKGPAMERPSSFSEEETAEASSSGD